MAEQPLYAALDVLLENDPPPSEWSALQYGFQAEGGRTHVEQETQA